jgi:hypothetical protein
LKKLDKIIKKFNETKLKGKIDYKGKSIISVGTDGLQIMALRDLLEKSDCSPELVDDGEGVAGFACRFFPMLAGSLTFEVSVHKLTGKIYLRILENMVPLYLNCLAEGQEGEGHCLYEDFLATLSPIQADIKNCQIFPIKILGNLREKLPNQKFEFLISMSSAVFLCLVYLYTLFRPRKALQKMEDLEVIYKDLKQNSSVSLPSVGGSPMSSPNQSMVLDKGQEASDFSLSPKRVDSPVGVKQNDDRFKISPNGFSVEELEAEELGRLSERRKKPERKRSSSMGREKEG